MAPYETSTVTFEYLSASHGLKLVAKRYVPQDATPAGLTLLFTHCTGSHKESWEVITEDLLQLKDANFNTPVVREAWSVDWQSHGEAASVNKDILGAEDGISVTEYAAGLRWLISSEHLSGHQLIGIGHSAGVTAILLSTMSLPRGEVPYAAIILMEPSLVTREAFKKFGANRTQVLAAVHKAIDARRNTWKDRHEALQYFRKRLPWKLWDERILDLFTRYGIKDTQVEQDGEAISAVTLACDILHEKKAYTDTEPHYVAMERLATLDSKVEAHYIFGERSDVVPKYCHDSILPLRRVASVQYVQQAGHFALQENPDALAVCIARVLRSVARAVPKLRISRHPLDYTPPEMTHF